jgi:hypothetical protein
MPRSGLRRPKIQNLYLGNSIKVVTDHHALCWLPRKKNQADRLARWSLQLHDLDIEVIHKSGRLHTDADAFSRHSIEPQEPELGIPMLLCEPSSLTFPGLPHLPLLQQECVWETNHTGLEKKNQDYPTHRLTRNFLLKGDVLYHLLFF